MLATLRIKNLALVSDLTIELQPGFNAITGETGAGKSILIGALNLVLGERADRTLIRSGADACSVEAAFDIRKLSAPLPDFLEENGLEPCEDDQLLVKRVFSTSGSNKQFVNGSPTTLNVLKQLGNWLVDIHGPHDHQSLLHASRQLAILDAFGGLAELRGAFTALVTKRRQLEDRKADLIVDEQTYAQQLDLLRYQVSEISSARLTVDEEEEIENEYQRASNAARLTELCQAALNLLGEDENALLTQVGSLGRLLHELGTLDARAAHLVDAHQQAAAILSDLQGEISHYADRVDVDPARLNELEQRVDLFHSLKRKYGSTLADVIDFGNEAHAKLQNLEQRDEELARINAELESIDTKILQAGDKLSAARKKLIPKLSKVVIRQLNDLGFPQSEFDITLDSSHPKDGHYQSTGLDKLEFLFAPNKGEPARPLRAIASSGEMARVMLALKTVLAAEDEVPVLVFDEIDANVGGETANVVGEKMGEIGRNRQALCVTHLAPVAARGDAHYVVSKKEKDGRTISEIKLLNRDQRVDELTRMLGGKHEAARKHAEALLG